MIEKLLGKQFFCSFILLVLVSLNVSAQGLTVSGGSTKKWTYEGKEYKTVFHSTGIISGPDHMLSTARMSGVGEILYSEDGKTRMVTSDEISSIDGDTITINLSGDVRRFDLDGDTVICKQDHSIRGSDLTIGDIVVVNSYPDRTNVTSVRIGPLLVTGLMSGNLKPVEYTCGKLKPIAWWEFWK